MSTTDYSHGQYSEAFALEAAPEPTQEQNNSPVATRHELEALKAQRPEPPTPEVNLEPQSPAPSLGQEPTSLDEYKSRLDEQNFNRHRENRILEICNSLYEAGQKLDQADFNGQANPTLPQQKLAWSFARNSHDQDQEQSQ